MPFNFPNSPAVGDEFSPPGGPLYKWDGIAWKTPGTGDGGGAAATIISDTPPADPIDGQLWYESDTGNTFIWYEDADSGQWVQQNMMKIPAPVSGTDTIVRTYTPGSYSWKKELGLKEIIVELFGPGGGSGGAGATAASQAAAGGGGGGGAYCRKVYKASDLGATEALVVGAGGAAGTSTSAGGAGTNTTFKGMIAGGGGGGTHQVSTGVMGNTSSRGGAGSATGGDLNVNGTSGMPGVPNFHALGQAQPGYGGTNLFGGNLYFPLRVVTQSAPNDAPNVGLGANGGANGASQTAVNGAAGGPGYAIITEIYDYGTLNGDFSTFMKGMKRTVVTVDGVYIPTPGMKFVDVECVGTGGNGGLAPVTTAGQSAAGAGGGGGGYTKKLYAAADINPAGEAYVIGAVAPASSGNGGDTTFKGMTAGGGAGGAIGVAATTGGQTAAAAGGPASGGDINIMGKQGERGIRSAHGVAGWGMGGVGGCSALGPNANVFFIASSGGSQQNGIGPGAGGSGAANGTTQAATVSGGFGAKGCIIFTEYF